VWAQQLAQRPHGSPATIVEGHKVNYLLLVFGLPGSGKSALAGRLASRLGAVRISSDYKRTRLGLRGDYSKDSIDAVYEEMFRVGLERLKEGRPVILDGSFSSERYRQRAAQVAAEAGVPLRLIRMVANEEVTLARVGRKRHLSEAGPDAYRLLKEKFDAVSLPHLELDSSRSRPGQLVEAALEYLKATAER